MKIAVIGYSGSGKSTLAKEMGAHYGIKVLHLDSVHWMSGWVERQREDEQKIVEEFLDSNDEWVIDGNYTKLSYERRLKEADMIIMMQFNRFASLVRVTRRYHRYKGTTRDDIGEGCNEKLDFDFIKWVLWKGRRKGQRSRFRNIRETYSDKVTWIRNQKQLDAFRDRIFKEE